MENLMKRKILILFTGILLLGACEKKVVEIGFIGPLSGRYSDMGTEARDGILLAIDEWNGEADREGPKISLSIVDDKNEIEEAKRGVLGFFDQEMDIVIGPMTSTLSLAVVDFLKDYDALIISPTASTVELSGLDDGFYRLVEAYIQEGQHLSRYARDTLGLSRLAVVYDSENASYSEGWLQSLSEDFEARGGQLVSTVILDLSKSDSHYEGAKELLESDPDVVVLALPGLDAALISQQIALLGGDVQLMLSTWAKDEDLITNGGSAVEGAFFTEMFRTDSSNPEYIEFRNQFMNRYGYEPGFAAALGYESVLFVEEILREQSGRESYRETSKRVQSFPGLQGVVQFDEYGDIFREHHYGVVKNGEFVYIEK